MARTMGKIKMKKHKKDGVEFKYADAWLLLSIIYASEKGDANLCKIISYGDFINHAIFAIEELEGGFFRLANSGYIIEDNECYRPTDKIIMPYIKFSSKNKSVSKQLAFIREQLNSPDWTEDYDPSKANEGINYRIINKKAFESAYSGYRKQITENT